MNIESHIINSIRIIIAIGLCAIVSACAFPEKPNHKFIQDLTIQSTIIFEGKVANIEASNVSTVPASPHTAIVKVEEIFKGPGLFSAFKNKNVTILVKDTSRLKPESKMIFFTTGWVLGNNIALREVGRLIQYDTVSLISQIKIISKRQKQIPIEENVREAHIVFSGKVIETKELKDRIRGRYISEHDPLWKLAVVEPSVVLKGNKQINSIQVLFPSSTDVSWYDIPKLSVGQQGIWLLKMDGKFKKYIIRERNDFLPLEQFDYVKSITQDY